MFSRQYNDWMREVSPHDSERIWSRACETFPSIARAKILEEVVGLRPHRFQPRVEVEVYLCYCTGDECNKTDIGGAPSLTPGLTLSISLLLALLSNIRHSAWC